MDRTIFLLVGPSGAGNTALTNALIHQRSGLDRGVTVTTRERRPEEVDDKDYIFVSQTQFEKMKSAGEFLETDSVFGESYGIPLNFDKQAGNLIFIVTLAGARAVRSYYPEAKTILILPSSAERARQRVIARTAPNENERIASYGAESQAADAYDIEVGFDAVIRNDNFEVALRELETVYMRRGRSQIHSMRPYQREIPSYISSRLAT